MEKLIGRKEEQEILHEAFISEEPELVALFGRRRVGKTFLIREYFKDNLIFEFSGEKEAKLAVQLYNFAGALGDASGSNDLYKVPANWPQAFEQLRHFIGQKRSTQKKVIFFDEFPWLQTQNSGFLGAFDYWWNSWGTKQPDLIVVICGSAASWMIKNIVRNREGLHNRITRKIRLLPFTVKETATYLQARYITLDHYSVLQLYMALGGIPHYLKEIKKGESATQAIDRLCFTKDGFLSTEFKELFHSLFDNPQKHLDIVRALAKVKSGLTRTQIIEEIKLSSGGTVTATLDELIESGFVVAWPPYDRKIKNSIYKLSDEFTHFYLKFMENNMTEGAGAWEKFSAGQSWRSWSGIAFERICLKHVTQLKKALNIGAVYTEASVWRYAPTTGKGAQIDLLIDRRDFAVNLCEMKFSENPFTIDKAYALDLEHKRAAFKSVSGTRKSLFLTMVTTFGVQPNPYSQQYVQASITMDALFD